MKIRTFDTNLIDAINQDTSVPDRNLPIYLTNYDVRTIGSQASDLQILWSTVGFLPSYEERRRVFHLRLCVQVNRLTEAWIHGWTTFVLDFSAIDAREYDVDVEGPLSGYGTFSSRSVSMEAMEVTENSLAWSTYGHVTYEYERDIRQLLLHIRDVPSSDVSSFPAYLYLDIEIKDDVGEETYPSFFPNQIVTQIAKIPASISSRGEGIRIVVPMFICCPDELKTMQLSSLDPELEGAFNPLPEIERLFELQGLTDLPPSESQIEYLDAESNPLSPLPPINWKENPSMRSISFLLQILFTVAPRCKAIVLYSFGSSDAFRPPYMRWLQANVNIYDMVLEYTAPVKDTMWTLDAFDDTLEFYRNVQQLLYTSSIPFIVATGSDGTDAELQYPNRWYRFNVAGDFPIAVGGFALQNATPDQATPTYNIDGPYSAWQFSSGGYCNTIDRPQEQYGINYLTQYGRPDVAGYATSYKLVSDASSNQLFNASGTGAGAAVLAGLLALIMSETDRRWNFKLILYRKMLSLCTQYYSGQNVGTEVSNRFNAGLYQFWNPIIGMGNVNGSYLYQMCSVIRNFQVVQISATLRMSQNLSFVNVIPRNTFGDLIKRQPTMGPSSIFSLFYIKRVDGNDSPSPNDQPIRFNDVVYFVDITEKYALAYATDEDQKWYVVISTVDYSSRAQRWTLRSYVDPSSVNVIYAFEDIMIIPYLQPQYSFTTQWNATGSRVPASPSITTNPIDVESFFLSTDPAADAHITEIKNSIDNDLTGYSYYINISYTITVALGGDPNNVQAIKSYLANPYDIGMESPVTAIYQARNDLVQLSGTKPIWTAQFDAYPQWVLIPVPGADQNVFAYPYQTQFVDGGQYMIYNPVLQSYLYTTRFPVPGQPPFENQLRMQPLTPALKDAIPFNSFVFRFSSQTPTVSTHIFSTSVMEKTFVGLNPYTINPPVYNPNIVPPWQLTRRKIYLTTRTGFRFTQNTPDIQSALTNQFMVIGRPELEDPDDLDRDMNVYMQAGSRVDFGDLTASNRLDLEWVFKEYIISETTQCRLMSMYPYSNADIASATYTGASLSFLGTGNANGRAPSMEPRFLQNLSMFWYIVSDDTITDVNAGYTPESTYGLLVQGLTNAGGEFNPTISQLQIYSIIDQPDDKGIGVFGPLPQPSILTIPFPPSPDSVRWNASSIYFFSGRPQTHPIGGYLYLFELYTFYTMTPVTTGTQTRYSLSTTTDRDVSPSLKPIVSNFNATQDPTVTFMALPLTW